MLTGFHVRHLDHHPLEWAGFCHYNVQVASSFLKIGKFGRDFIHGFMI